MTRNKTFTFIILAIVIILIAARFLIKKLSIVERFEKILQQIKQEYGTAIAQNVERIYRFETNNLKSDQFEKTFSPGMMAFGDSYPYGWNSLKNSVWRATPSYRPTGVVFVEENPGMYGTGGGKQPFLKFPTLKAAMMTLAAFLSLHDNNAGRWFSLQPEQQDDYNDKISEIKTQFT